MTTYTALTTLNGKEAAEALSEALETMDPAPYGVGTFEIEDGTGRWEVGAYFMEPPDRAGLALLALLHAAQDFAVSDVPDVDWVAKVRRELTPVAAGRFFVYGSHDADKVPEGVEPLLIEASMAFGTGHHGTTQGCLRALDRLAGQGFQGRSVIDVGCGTAVLAMGAVRIWPEVALASDIDAVAVEVAEANVAANRLEGRVRCVVAAGLDHPDLQQAAPFDLIFANILKGPLIDMAPDLCGNAGPGGYLILSGILNEQADEVIDAYAARGAGLVQREEIGEWTTLTLQKTG